MVGNKPIFIDLLSLKKYEEGENFLYLGKERPLKIVVNKSIPLKYENGTFYLSNAFLKLANKVFVDWYKEYYNV